MAAKIAIGGKGGVGKTTLCAVWAGLFAQDGFDVLAIDADPNTTLASAFGIDADQRPEPLVKMRDLIVERTGAGKETLGAYFKLNPKVSDLPEKYWVNVELAGVHEGPRLKGALKLLTLGAITQAGSGCACPEGAFLKALLIHSILQREELVLVDLAAGVEFMGRASVQGVDALVVVVEPGGRSIETANNVAKMAGQLGIKHIAAVVNKITDATQIEEVGIKLSKGMAVLGSVKYDPQVQRADLELKSVFEASASVLDELRDAKDKLAELIGLAKRDTDKIGRLCS